MVQAYIQKNTCFEALKIEISKFRQFWIKVPRQTLLTEKSEPKIVLLLVYSVFGCLRRSKIWLGRSWIGIYMILFVVVKQSNVKIRTPTQQTNENVGAPNRFKKHVRLVIADILFNVWRGRVSPWVMKDFHRFYRCLFLHFLKPNRGCKSRTPCVQQHKTTMN